MKRFIVLAWLAFSLGACKKNVKSACGTQVCTSEFATIIFQFTDKGGSPTAITDIVLVNMRTNQRIKIPPPNPYANTVAGSFTAADDNTKDQFSSEGDQIRITAKSVETGKVKSALVTIAGGCNCHVSKLAGPDKVAFD